MKLIKQSLLLSLLLLATPSFGASNLESGVAEVGKVIVEGMVKEDKSKIAIVDFSDLNQNVNNLGRYLAEKLINELLKNKKDKQYEVVERRQLNKVLQELKLSQSGLSDSKTIKKVGKILNVDALITGSLTDLGNDIDINARIVSVETGKIISTASVKIPKVGSVATLMGQNNIQNFSDSSSNKRINSSKKESTKKHVYVELNRCAGCHGQVFRRKAMGVSKVVKNLKKEQIIKALKGYRDGEYGGAFKSIMRSQVSSLSDEEIESIAYTITK